MDAKNIGEDEKKVQLFLSQKDTLDKFLETKAITKEQYDKSLNTLIEKNAYKHIIKTLI